jgi:hypothetical protein
MTNTISFPVGQVDATNLQPGRAKSQPVYNTGGAISGLDLVIPVSLGGLHLAPEDLTAALRWLHGNGRAGVVVTLAELPADGGPDA